ncbi:tRNA A37 threonylcarbamoyladenosine modification protein TsaB [Entomoplasma freundtii]|uniref:tRNA N6-adenosine(37)-N6-threonylcarbamoyltransferase complex dimerization subunit TsaB n=1 Tax=Entomoplasma freundtii TaxID=74700 RepID=A0A2K8NQY2_9MOLU|nr:tRNA (adenosine(37)-N6)-threonylcarbamoyltransferase complex dimerization subunit type 1 TsaB [Entomoplasma freundtii]ATZ16194.1 tRNA N6-adenosine(37)-N6-threonylcarbamoyltransferase complex dimerization subunit TsaB [Entomoplasma freundtii]TDY56905.1 tRNA A37 threonylcarbamoyladenosine modification protein TsaB [Entomoplasma freundtii]
MNLFIDTANGRLVYLLEKDNQVVDLFLSAPTKKISDEAIHQLNLFLTKNHQSLALIENFYVTTGPGSYSGIRVGLTLVKTVKAISPQTNIYLISSLLFQVGLAKGISLLDARGQKVFYAVYNQAKLLEGPSLIEKESIEVVNEPWAKKGYKIFEDNATLDYKKNFLALKEHFQLANSISDIKPLYLKGYL